MVATSVQDAIEENLQVTQVTSKTGYKSHSLQG